ncbi:MAG: hypothetical protein ACRDF5_00660 [bacterium]
MRGLGGGIEYAVAADFCATISPRFVDVPRPSCAQLEDALRRAMERWAGAHPVLRFTSVTGRIAAQLPPADAREPWRGFGAEIDLFALDPQAYPQVGRLGAWTSLYSVFAAPLGTNGRLLPGGTITSADIIFNTRSCYYLDPGLSGSSCNHFESLALHEIGHTLDLHHPGQHRARNFDSDANPLNPIPIDCQDPSRGLRLSPFIDERAVMNRGLGEPMPVVFVLSHDDLGGRNFHYPICPGAKRVSIPDVAARLLDGLARFAVSILSR